MSMELVGTTTPTRENDTAPCVLLVDNDVGTTLFTLIAGPLAAFGTYRVALWRTKKTLWPWFIVYSVLSLPYTTLKNTVAMVAGLREITGDRRWVVTNRLATATDPAR